MSEKPVFDLLGDKHGYGNESETELPPAWAQEQKTETTNCFHYLVVVVGGELMSKLALLAGVGVVKISSGKVIKLHTT